MAKLVLIGIDGMDPYVFEKYQAELPHLSAIGKQGCYRRNPSVFPPDSIPAWVTIFTGEHPAQHGWLDNIDYEDIRKGETAYNIRDLQGNTFWDLLSREGKRVCVINPLLAYPVWPVNGVMASGPVFISGEKQIYPNELTARYSLPELGGMTEYPEESQLEAFFEATLKSTEDLGKFGLELFEAGPWDLYFLSFFTLDRLQHFLWRFSDPSDPQYPGPSRLENAVLRAYQLFDTIVGQFIERLDGDTGLVVISDHGHGMRPTMLLNANELLRQEHLLKTVEGKKISSQSKKLLEITKNIGIKVVGATLGERWIYRIGRMLPKKTRKALKKSDYLIDKENSTAWASEMGGGAAVGGIVINAAQVKSGAEYEKTAAQILACLEKINASEKSQVVQWAKMREEGNFYPDIIFELAPDFSVGRSLFCPTIEKNPRHRTVSGGHKREGVLFAYQFGERAARINSISDIFKAVTGFVLTDGLKAAADAGGKEER